MPLDVKFHTVPHLKSLVSGLDKNSEQGHCRTFLDTKFIWKVSILLQIEASDHFLSSFFIAILIEWSIGIIFSINIFGIAVVQKKFAAKSFFKVLERKTS